MHRAGFPSTEETECAICICHIHVIHCAAISHEFGACLYNQLPILDELLQSYFSLTFCRHFCFLPKVGK